MHLADLDTPSVSDVPDGRGVLVRVIRVGVDGTDREVNAAEYGSAPDGHDLPRIHVVHRRLSVRRPPAHERTVGLERGAFEEGETLPPDVPESLVAAILASRSTRTGTD